MEIAIYGGTFDPPTLAHEAIMRACLAKAGVDELWIMPSGIRTDKLDMSSDTLRLGLLGLLIDVEFSDLPVVLSDFEMKLPKPTETYKTVTVIEEAYPEYRFWYVFGADSIESMPDWHNGEWLRRNLNILAVPRAGYELPAETSHLKHLEIGEIAMAGISSSGVRQALKQGKPIEHLVNPIIAEYLLLQ